MQRQLQREAFKFAKAKGVPIPKEGKTAFRPLVVAPIESRIVQRAILDVLLTVPAIKEKAVTPYSFGGVRKANEDDRAAVPAAIKAVLEAVGEGLTYVIKSDIAAFFTAIPKLTVTAMVEEAVPEPGFIKLFSQAITVELSNMAELSENAEEFPIYEIGVAQGSSLSPLLGNLLLHEFDAKMNSGACRCLRYIDDFMVLAPSMKAARLQFEQGMKLLQNHGLKLANDKTQRSTIEEGIDFLGISIRNGTLCPSKKSRRRLIEKIEKLIKKSEQEFVAFKKARKIGYKQSLLGTMSQVSEIVQGWGKHYSFCNEKNALNLLDNEIDELIRKYMGLYGSVRKNENAEGRRRVFGMTPLVDYADQPFEWPKIKAPALALVGKCTG
jgi:retron-type reverse transcriptase